MHASEARLQAMDQQTARLSEVRLGMTVALWMGTVAPNSITRLAC